MTSKTETPIKKVAVIGAGVMGAGIAAHVANAGVPVVLLDIVPHGPEEGIHDLQVRLVRPHDAGAHLGDHDVRMEHAAGGKGGGARHWR